MLSSLIDELRGQGDPLADEALADYQCASSETQSLLEKGMRQGLANVGSMPDSFRRLLQDGEEAAAAICPEQVDLAMQPYAWVGPMWLSIALGPGSLAHTYSDPGIAAVLMRTGNLLPQTVSRRLLETQLWNISVIKPGGMAIGGPGYVHTLQVRLLHARVRASLTQRGWASPDDTHSVPIDQWQMLRTWLDFTVVPFEAFGRIGLGFGSEQTRQLYRVWRLIGHLLGIDATLLAKVTDHTVAMEILNMVDSQWPAPDQNSRVLTHAMLDAIGNRLAPILQFPADISVLLMHSLCRLFHGDELADRLGIEANWTAALLPIMADANRLRLRRIQEEHDYQAVVQQQSLKAFGAIESGVSDDTLYQAMSASLVINELPRLYCDSGQRIC